MGDHTGKQPLELSTMSSPRRYTRGSLIDRNMKIREVREAISNGIPCEGYLSTQLFVFSWGGDNQLARSSPLTNLERCRN